MQRLTENMALFSAGAIAFFQEYKTFLGEFIKSHRENGVSSKMVCTCTCIGLIVSYCGYQLVWGKKLPPGPWSVTILRTLAKKKSIAATARQFKETYGNIFRIKLGVRNFVFLTDFSLIQVALNDKKLQGRTDFFTFKTVTFNRNIGLINSEGEPWHSNRKFCLKHLGNLGLGNNRMQEYIHFEASMLLEYFDRSVGEPIVLGPAINVTVLNILWKLVAGRRYQIDDAEIQDFMNMMNELVSIFEGPIALVNMMPCLKWLPDCLLNRLGKKTLLESRNKLLDFTMKEIDRHEAAYSETVANDLIDHYLHQILVDKKLPGSIFASDKMNLAVTIIDLFFAGSETTASTLKWFLLYMAQNMKIQRKIQDALDLYVPSPLIPCLEDRDNLTFLRATIKETMRLSSLVPQGLPHVATADTKLAGYDIPKGSIITPCLEVCHNSKQYFERPDDFNPDHFLDNRQNVRVDLGFLPFSLGPRRCIGETLAEAELFLLTATLLQTFEITPGPNMNEYLKETHGGSNLLNLPPKIEVVMTKRNIRSAQK